MVAVIGTDHVVPANVKNHMRQEADAMLREKLKG